MLDIDTFRHGKGGQSFFKALGHPLAAEKMHALLKTLHDQEAVSLYDPSGWLQPLSALYPLTSLKSTGFFVQDFERLGELFRGQAAQAVTDLVRAKPKALLISDFGLETHLSQIGHLLPPECQVFSLDEVKLPDTLLTRPKAPLDPLNFATNFAFFREQDGLHTRLFTANYWTRYSGQPARIWLRLLDHEGHPLATWEESLKKAGEAFILDSHDIQKRFQLPDFCGQLFLHVVGAAGHDVVKYALDTWDDRGQTLSCTHDANAWPADYYAGLPAPRDDEKVLLWVQNSHPCPIPARSIGFNPMGQEERQVFLEEEVPPFGSLPVDVGTLLPDLRWPQQIEVFAGKHFVRPRYEVVRKEKRRIAHANVERTDLTPDPVLKKLTPHFGKGFLVPAPLLPWKTWQSEALPTPMARSERTLPVALFAYDSEGHEIGVHRFGPLQRAEAASLIVNEMFASSIKESPSTYGHMEMVYDFEAGDEANGWLHGLFRYDNGVHQAETLFGAHIFNTALTYKEQPFSYRGTPPGLTTRLFLRSGRPGTTTLCHLIYPASTPWHPHSSTQLFLYDGRGDLVAEAFLKIPCGGSRFWRVKEMFSNHDMERAGDGHYVIIRDATCRLFGYHGVMEDRGCFSLDHMFGF